MAFYREIKVNNETFQFNIGNSVVVIRSQPRGERLILSKPLNSWDYPLIGRIFWSCSECNVGAAEYSIAKELCPHVCWRWEVTPKDIKAAIVKKWF
jgi:hypothetical protein